MLEVIMKKYLLFCVFLLISFYVFADTVVGSIDDGENVVYCTMVGDSIPFVLIDSGRNGKTKEFFVFYGQERMGPYSLLIKKKWHILLKWIENIMCF